MVLMLLDRYGDRLSSGTHTAFLEPHCLAAALLLSLLPQGRAFTPSSGSSSCQLNLHMSPCVLLPLDPLSLESPPPTPRPVLGHSGVEAG